MDLDQAAFEKQLSLATNESFVNAKRIYNEGAHSKSYAQITLASSGLLNDVSSGDEVLGGVAVDATQVTAIAHKDAPAASTILKVTDKQLLTLKKSTLAVK